MNLATVVIVAIVAVIAVGVVALVRFFARLALYRLMVPSGRMFQQRSRRGQ